MPSTPVNKPVAIATAMPRISKRILRIVSDAISALIDTHRRGEVVPSPKNFGFCYSLCLTGVHFSMAFTIQTNAL